MAQEVLKAVGLEKSFGKTKALRGVDLSLSEGEVLGFIGPNGAGKTTTIRILLGSIKSDSGSAEIFNKDVWASAVEIHKRIAYVPGDVNLWQNLTGGEVIDLFTALRGIEADKSKKAELIERFEFDPSKKCKTYSKGNRQKVALIAALASDADLYIFDEPTSGLDPLMEQVFQECVREQKAKGKSILLSSHILSEVEKLCSSVAIIRRGKIVQSGTLDELKYLTRINMSVQTKALAKDFESTDGVFNLVKKDSQIEFQADSDKIEAIMNKLAPLGITLIQSTPPTLEDLFMRHYDKDGDDR